MAHDLETILDRLEIIDVLHRYALAIDGRDWAKLGSCFTPDAIALYGPVLGKKEGLAEIQLTCQKALEPLDASQHLIGTYEISLSGDRARTRCYVQAQHTKAGTEGGENFLIGGMYLDEFLRTPDGWRIRERELRILWQDGNPKVLGG